MTENAIFVYDFTDNNEGRTKEEILEWLLKYTKKWTFQQEEVGRKHFQGRFSLKEKKRLQNINNILKWHLTPTSEENKGNMFYVMKEESRISGPWSDEDPKPRYIPPQALNYPIPLPWQKTVRDMLTIYDERHIDCIIDTKGCVGKSILCCQLDCEELARYIPPINNTKEVMGVVMELPSAKAYLFDMARAMNKDKLNELYVAIETLKNGFAYDTRYTYKCKWMPNPNIFVFTNKKPDMTMLSKDRWRFWYVDENKELKKYRSIKIKIMDLQDDLKGQEV